MSGVRSAGIYVRISSDPEGTALGVDRQSRDCRELAVAKGWRVVGTYEDNDVSASRGKKPRPAYARLLDDIRGGRVDAVVVWDLDRLHRRPVELEEFLDLAKTHGVALASVGGDVDLSTEQGVLIAGIKAQVGRYETDHISRRVMRKQEELRSAGKAFTGGIRPFGYASDRMTVIPEEAAEIRRMAASIIAGASITSVVADLNCRGVPTVSVAMAAERAARGKPSKGAGSPWSRTSVQSMLRKPRLAGLLTYRQQVIGEAAWEPVLDRETFRLLVTALDRRRPSHAMSNARKYLLSGLAVCGVCGQTVQIAHQATGVLNYKCSPNAHVGRNQANLDAHVVREVLEYAARHPFRVDEVVDPEQARIAAEIAALERRQNEAADEFAVGNLPAKTMARVSSTLQAQIEVLRDLLAKTAAVNFDDDLWVAFDLASGWESLTLHQKRAALLLYTERIVVHRAKIRGRGFDESTIEIVFRHPDRLRWKAIVDK